MTYPAGVVTRQVTFGSAFMTTSGNAVWMRLTLRPDRARMVWVATGSPAAGVEGTWEADATISLPVTDQDGWSDGRGGMLDVSDGRHTHLYVGEGCFLDDQGRRIGAGFTIGPFALPTDDLSPVDLDMLIPVTSTPGVAVSIPDRWSATLEDVEDARDAATLAQTAASSAATTATTKAAEASASATTATTAAGTITGAVAAAESSRDAAAASATAAQSARTGADQARDAAATAETNAAGSATTAAGSATIAQTAATNAGTARTAAETARDAAVTAKTGAETARTGAETARDAAVTARTGAETARTGAEAARDQTLSIYRTGTGSPKGAVTAPVGTIYADTAVTLGASHWRKATGAGNTGWVVMSGDTGIWSVPLLNGWGGTLWIRRTNNSVEVNVSSLTPGSTNVMYVLPAGFTPLRSFSWPHRGQTGTAPVWGSFSAANEVILGIGSALNAAGAVVTYTTRDPWPTSLPGTAV